MMAQETEGTAEELQVLETPTPEATAEQEEIAIAPVALPPKPKAEVAAEVPQLEEKLSHSPEDLQEMMEHEDELHGSLGEEEGDLKGNTEGNISSGTSKMEKRRQKRKEAIRKRYSFGLEDEVDDKDEGEGEGEAEAEEEESDEEIVDYKVEYKYENRLESVVSMLDEEGVGDQVAPPLETTARRSRLEEIFEALGEDTAKDSKEIFYVDPKYEDSDVASVASARSSKSTKPIKADTIQMKADFLRYFEMPSLSDISEEHEPDDLSLDNVSVDSTAQVKGTFVDPLSGDFHDSASISSEEVSLSAQEDQDDVEAAASPPSVSSEISDIPDIPASPEEKEVIKPKEINFEVPTSFIAIEVHDYDEEDDKGPRKEFLVDAMVQDFVDNILDTIVTNYERHKSENRLRSMLDRGKLLAELKDITDTYVFERYTNEFLNIRVLEYYKRIRNLRSFAQKDEENEDHVVRYNEALAKVDRLNLRLDAIKYKYEAEIAKMRLQLHDVQHFVYFTESRLEHKARKYLVRPDSDFLKRFVDWALRQMYAKRNEISDMRLRLIVKKTTLAELQEKLNQLEALSSTVSLQDYVSIQNDVINLGKKLEERTLDLNKIRAQYHTDVHLTHHNREKALALGDKLKHMKTTLANAIDEQRSLRASLYSKKLERTRIREKRLALTMQGGILAMPALMYEYDRTVEHIEENQKRVTKLRDTLESLNRRVSQISDVRTL